MNTEEKRELLAEFLDRWPETAVREMKLSDYVDVENKETFTYWVETRMRPLGSILGSYSTKFGIYRRKTTKQLGGNYQNDDLYTWMNRFGNDRSGAFDAVKREVLDIIEFAQTGEFSRIDEIGIPNLFKWKVASLYSNERLVPIFKQETLLRIAAHYGLKPTSDTKVSRIHDLLISNKPADEDIYDYMERLYTQFGTDHHDGKQAPLLSQSQSESQGTPTRHASATAKNTAPQLRRGTNSYIADQKHNKIQEVLLRKLIEKHGESAVHREQNWVDVKLVLADEIVFYEVKSASYPYPCITQALGQTLGYIFKDKDTRRKRIVVVGPYPPNASDREFIAFVKSSLNIEFDYEYIDYTSVN